MTRTPVGILPALTTPFEDGAFAPHRLRENIHGYETAGVDGFLVCGSTGETAYLAPDERAAVLQTVRDAVAPNKTLVAGVLAEATLAAVDGARLAADAGADAVLVSTPCYFRAQMTESVLIDHFAAVADASPAGVLLYNVPNLTGVTIPVEAVEELARHPRVVGMKDSSGSLEYALDVLAVVGPSFALLCGSAKILQPALSSGARGAILASACAAPEPFLKIADAVRAGRTDDALGLQRSVLGFARAIATYGVPAVKCAMDLRGLYGGPPRRPLQPVTESARLEIGRIVERLVADGALAERELRTRRAGRT
jgi:4-hydroxy-2-oxoglutarate aldolase